MLLQEARILTYCSGLGFSFGTVRQKILKKPNFQNQHPNKISWETKYTPPNISTHTTQEGGTRGGCDMGGNNRQFTVGYAGVSVGFEKGPPQAIFFGVLTRHLKARFPYAINFFTIFSNKNTISSISGGITFNVLGIFWVLLGVFGLFRAVLGFFGLLRVFLRFFGLFGLSPTVGQQACLRRGAKKLSDFISKLSDNPTV